MSVADTRPLEKAFREIAGPVVVSRGRLLVTNYESLTMVAGYPSQLLPQAHEQDQVVSLPSGSYRCTVRQLCDPATEEAFEREPGFELLLARDEVTLPPTWETVPWARG